MKYYVYTWTDPRTNEIFYIGKGRGNRAYNIHHNLRCENKRKRILNCGYTNNQIVTIIRENLSEQQSLDIEEKLINKYKIIEEGGTLFNYRTKGLKSGSWKKIRLKKITNQICKLYQSGMTMLNISKIYNVHETTIRNLLLENKINIKSQGYTTPTPPNWCSIYKQIKAGKLSKRKACQLLRVSWPTLARFIHEIQLCGIDCTN